MRALRKRCTTLARLGWAVLPIGLIVYLVLTRTAVDLKVIFWFLAGAMATSVTVMVGSLLLYHRRSSHQLRLLVQAAVASAG